jgi:hypothetical protein
MVMKIPLTQSKVALVDDEDYERVKNHNWFATHNSNSRIWYAVMGHNVKLHQLILGIKNIDHIDGDGLNNTRANLREATSQQNGWNRRKPRQDYRGKESSKFKGVSKQTLGSSWCCRIVHSYKTYYIGSFKTEEEAAVAYDKKAIELFGEYAKLNFPNSNELILASKSDSK